MAIGILGGTFDPPHLGHLSIASSAITSGKVDKVIFIPTSTPPHKSRCDIAPDIHRLKMTEIMIRNHPEFSVSNIEIKRQGLSYTILTLEELKKLYPSEELHLIIGADMALTFDSWKNAKEIIDIAPPLIAARPGYTFQQEFGISEPAKLLKKYRKTLFNGIFTAPQYDISSTQLREAIYTGKLDIIQNNLDKAVFNYIKENNLYK